MEASNPVGDEMKTPFELQALAEARHYQLWLRDIALPFLGNRILELGAGIGNMSQHLPVRERLVLSDIEAEFVRLLEKKFAAGADGKVAVKKLESLKDPGLAEEQLDTIVSFNVLEHVEDDVGLLRDAIQLLEQSKSPGPKRLVSLVPAHQWAYSPIDKEFGHFRRYSDRTFRAALQAAGVDALNSYNYRSRYVNLPALIAWWLKGRVLGSSEIGTGGVKAFEALCPVIRPLDNFLHGALRLPLGNSLFTVYQVNDA